MNTDTPENTTQITNPTDGTGEGSERSIPDPSTPDVLIPDQVSANEAIEQNAIDEVAPPISTEPKPSYVKLAMRNMVKKRGLSLQHFFLTTIALLAFLIGLSYLTR